MSSELDKIIEREAVDENTRSPRSHFFPQRGANYLLRTVEILILSALVLVTRCANYREIFSGGEIHFVDGDCYARMTRARICFEHPGTIVRHHDFENFPEGTWPHTTAPFDYLIVALANILRAGSAQPLDLAGAFISPLLALALAWFLWGWAILMKMRWRFVALLLYASSPILAHGTPLGRPDHQSLLIVLMAVALCSEWTLAQRSSAGWALVNGASWSLAVWASVYEPLVLLAIVLIVRRASLFQSERRRGWILFGAIVLAALLIERRLPQFPFAFRSLGGWGETIGELIHVSLANPVWLYWCGGFILLAPLAFWRRRSEAPLFLLVVFAATFLLTIWQARWAYFFLIALVLLLPPILRTLRERFLISTASAVAFVPILFAWDQRFAPSATAARAENSTELRELRALAPEVNGPFLAPWWFSPALVYWSRQPGIVGSSHEAIRGTIDSAKFFAAENSSDAEHICRARRAEWVISYDAERLSTNCATILQKPLTPTAFCFVLDRQPSRAPLFLELVSQTARFKLYRVRKI